MDKQHPYRGIDQFMAALQGIHETGPVKFENGSYPGILVSIGSRAVGVVALEPGETRDMLCARLDEWESGRRRARL